MPDITTYLERIAGRSPNSAGFSRQGGGRGIHTVLVGDDGTGQFPAITFTSQLHSYILDVLGFTQPHPDGIKLNRQPPKAHPLYPWLFAERISQIVGLGRPTRVVSNPGGVLEVDPFDFVALYPCYEFTVEFTPRPYPVCIDADIREVTLSMQTDINGNPAFNVPTAQEWLRYTDEEKLPSAEYMTAQIGQFQFDAPGKNPPDGVSAGNGQLRMLLKKSGFIMTWYEVPYEYILTGNSNIMTYIEQGLGYVNQNTFRGNPPGTLLFIGIKVERYTPPVPKFNYYQSSLVFSGRKLCNISFMMVHMDPPLGQAPGPPINPNVIQAGHNLVPWAHTGKWYFAKVINVNPDAFGQPLFPSFPFELLFTNPGIT